MEPVSFGITGRIPSKKNGKRILRAGGRTFIGSSKDYVAWQREHVGPLKLQFGHFPDGKKYAVAIDFTAGDRRAFDLTNKAESVMDLMVDAGVIDDDNFNVVTSVTLRYAGYEKGRWYALVTLSEHA